MANSVLVLPVGGSASRMQGLPKFLLPYDGESVLIEKHINAAIAVEFSKIIVIVRHRFFDITQQYLSKYQDQIQIVKLNIETQTMCETLIFGLKDLDISESDQIVIALSDTALESTAYEKIYESCKILREDPFLVLFPTSKEQFGKLGQCELNKSGRVVAMQDKQPGCEFDFFWGMAGFPKSFLGEIEIQESHIGISVQRWLESGQSVIGLPTNSAYFDCGTFSEYKRFICSNTSVN